jgi:hypothetical protein
LLKLLLHIGLTPPLHHHNLKSDKQKQLFPGSLLCPKWSWSLSPLFPAASPSLFNALSLPPLPKF